MNEAQKSSESSLNCQSCEFECGCIFTSSWYFRTDGSLSVCQSAALTINVCSCCMFWQSACWLPVPFCGEVTALPSSSDLSREACSCIFFSERMSNDWGTGFLTRVCESVISDNARCELDTIDEIAWICRLFVAKDADGRVEAESRRRSWRSLGFAFACILAKLFKSTVGPVVDW